MGFKTTEEAKEYYQLHKEDFRRRREEWKKRDPDGFRAVQRRGLIKYMQTPKGIYSILKDNSKKRNKPFTLTVEEFTDWYLNKEKKCFYCKKQTAEWEGRLEIERVNNDEGYVLDNMELACSDCNGVKGNILSEEEMLLIGDLVMRKRWQPKLSIVIPIHAAMENGDFFLWRTVQSLMMQSFQDFEIVITQAGSMPVNTNAGMKKARGELIKILYLDDCLAHKDSLKNIVEAFDAKTQWLATGCLHQRFSRGNYEDPHAPHFPIWSGDIHMGNNTIGSPSVITVRNEGHLRYDERLSYLLDCELYKRYFDTYGKPVFLNDLNVVIGIHEGQTSNLMPDSEKQQELEYVTQKYV